MQTDDDVILGVDGLVLSRPDVVTPTGHQFHWLADVPYRREDGTDTTLAVWWSPCAVCGKPFTLATPGAIGGDQSRTKSFGMRHCEDHRLTQAEVKGRWQAGIKASRKAKP